MCLLFVFSLAFRFLFVFSLGSFPLLDPLWNVSKVSVALSSYTASPAVPWWASQTVIPLDSLSSELGYTGPREAWNKVTWCVSFRIQTPEIRACRAQQSRFLWLWQVTGFICSDCWFAGDEIGTCVSWVWSFSLFNFCIPVMQVSMNNYNRQW